MEFLLIAVVVVVVVALVSALAPRVGIAGPLALVAIGIGVSLLPIFPAFEVDPEIILVGVLPPLLYSAAISLPAIEFRRDLRPISGLALILVLASTAALTGFFMLVIPGIDLYLAIALGAILSPTDAVATSIARRLGISPRVLTMLDGESLLNDATALVLLRTAIAAIAVGSVSVGSAIWSFVWGVLIALVLGVVVGLITLRLRTWVSNSAANTAISFVVPFVAYLPTEELGGSGLVAAVVAGIVTAQGAARWFTPEQRLSSELNWRTVEFILEGAVFLLMGLELKEVVRANLENHQGLWQAAWLAASTLGIVLLVRAIYVSGLISIQSRRARRMDRGRLESFNDRIDDMAAGRSSSDDPERVKADGKIFKAPTPKQREKRVRVLRTRVSRSLADLDYYQSTPLGWKHGAVIVWGGMRGVVTLAAAQTLPEGPLRALLVLIAFLVAVGGLMLQGLTLPALVRLLKLEDSNSADAGAEEDDRLDAELRDAAASALSDSALTRRSGESFPEGLLDRVVKRYNHAADEENAAIAQDERELRLVAIEAMRGRLHELSSGGTFSTAALKYALAELDADQISLQLRLGDSD